MPKRIIDEGLHNDALDALADPEELPRVQELNDDDRQKLILQKARMMIQQLVWFVVSDLGEYPKIAEKVSQINKLLAEIGMHYSNAERKDFTPEEKQMIDELLNLEAGNPAKFMNVVLPLYLSLHSKASEDYRHMDGLTPDVQAQLFLISANAQLRAFLREQDHDSLLKLGVVAAALNKIVHENQELYIEKYTAVTQLSNELEMFLATNILKTTEEFDINYAEELLRQTRQLLRISGFSVQ